MKDVRKTFPRRQFAKFIAGASAIGSGFSLKTMGTILAQGTQNKPSKILNAITDIPSLSGPIASDKLSLAPGLEYYLIATSGDVIGPGGLKLGTNCDFNAYLPHSAVDEMGGFLIINHESPDQVPLGTGSADPRKKTKNEIEVERQSVGFSIVELTREPKLKKWGINASSTRNFQINGTSEIEFSSERLIGDKRTAIGTMANCSGGLTSWGTFLSCEENIEDYWGYATSERSEKDFSSRYGWEKQFDFPSEHYGWVVEVSPSTRRAKKLIALGRFAHEGALVWESGDGRSVVYMGDDTEGGCLYKFIASKKGSLDEGTLWVANLKRNRWEALDFSKDKRLQKKYGSQTDVLINARDAARLVGGTPLDRPEGIARHPITGDLFVSLTNNVKEKNYWGSILAISEVGGKVTSQTFTSRKFLMGSHSNGLACPDNLCFSSNGGLWVTNDISGKYANKGEYEGFGNNSLFYIPTIGSKAGKPFKLASAPNEAEFTGPCLMPDQETLILSVQHPGEYSPAADKLSSHWPAGGNTRPRSAVIAITGPALRNILQQS